MRLDFHAESVTDYGGITGDGLGNLLGAPKHEPLELLVREAVQNTWDARLKDSADVEFGIEYSMLAEDAHEFLCHHVLHSQPSPLRDLRSSQPRILLVWDRGTRGLAGPVRPTEAEGEYRDFVNFVYMIGETKQERDHQNTVTGGTYGYGRSAFFRASRVRTILVHSRTDVGGDLESRFIGIAWVDKYDGPDGVGYTGRHWWGTRHHDDWLGPVIGIEADEVARRLGMPLPAAGETGTTIMVLDPAVSADGMHLNGANEEGDDQEASGTALDQVVSSLLWNCWPRMVAGGLKFVLRWDGEAVEIPDPARHPRLRSFVRAFDVLRERKKESQMARTFDIELLRPEVHLGRLGLARTPFVQGPADPDPSCPTGVTHPFRHIALMRNTLLVLKYLEVSRTSPREGEQYAGVFVTEREVEEVFARSEPPSHDDWVKERIPDVVERRYVNVALRRIEEKVKEFIAPSVRLTEGWHRGSLAALADHLGTLLPGLDEAAEGRPMPRGAGGGGGGGRGRKPKVDIVSLARRPGDGEVSLDVHFSIQHLPDSTGSTVSFKASVLTAGGRAEGEAPAGRRTPIVKGWQLGEDGLMSAIHEGQALEFDVPSNHDRGIIRVLQPEDCTLDIQLDADGLERSD